MATEVDKFAEAYYEKVRRTETWSGIPLKPIYTPQDTAGIDYEREIADAGQYPFTRGIHADMYRGKLWTRRQGWGYGLGEDTNKQLRLLMQQGNTGFSIYRDLPSANGIDSDHPLAEGEVGVAGVGPMLHAGHGGHHGGPPPGPGYHLATLRLCSSPYHAGPVYCCGR